MEEKMAIDRTNLPLNLYKRGKVRDVYELDDNLLIVATDRISAFDYVLPTLIPDKGRCLNEISSFWFRQTNHLIPNHIVDDKPWLRSDLSAFHEQLKERSVLVRKLNCFPIEAIVRAYIVGSGWISYQKERGISGVELPPGLSFADRLPEPIFTPTTKVDNGHDENITFATMIDIIGKEDAETIRSLALDLFRTVSSLAAEKGIIIADTKFEFGRDENGRIVLIDEIFTPDSSRFWKVGDYKPGKEPPSFDKQFVRNYLNSCGWDKNSPPPPLPSDVIEKTREKYAEIFNILTGQKLV